MSSSAEKEAKAEIRPEVVAVDLPAPAGWKKKFTPKTLKKTAGNTPKRNEIVFISPTGQEIRNKKQLEQYIKAHPESPAASEFDWGTGDTPRRSSRISEKAKAIESLEDEPPKKRRKKSTPEKPSIDELHGDDEETKDGDGPDGDGSNVGVDTCTDEADEGNKDAEKADKGKDDEMTTCEEAIASEDKDDEMTTCEEAIASEDKDDVMATCEEAIANEDNGNDEKVIAEEAAASVGKGSDEKVIAEEAATSVDKGDVTAEEAAASVDKGDVKTTAEEAAAGVDKDDVNITAEEAAASVDKGDVKITAEEAAATLDKGDVKIIADKAAANECKDDEKKAAANEDKGHETVIAEEAAVVKDKDVENVIAELAAANEDKGDNDTIIAEEAAADEVNAVPLNTNSKDEPPAGEQVVQPTADEVNSVLLNTANKDESPAVEQLVTVDSGLFQGPVEEVKALDEEVAADGSSVVNVDEKPTQPHHLEIDQNRKKLEEEHPSNPVVHGVTDYRTEEKGLPENGELQGYHIQPSVN